MLIIADLNNINQIGSLCALIFKNIYLRPIYYPVKRLISVVLLFAFITVNFSKVIIWVNYELNKAQITKDYCVNKDKPMMHCCGKCKLKMQLAQDEEKQKSPAMPDIKNDIQLFGSPVYIT